MSESDNITGEGVSAPERFGIVGSMIRKRQPVSETENQTEATADILLAESVDSHALDWFMQAKKL
jgi:hypothetical protein